MPRRGRSRPPLGRALGIALLLVLGTTSATVLRPATPASAQVSSGFAEVVAFTGLVEPTTVRFAPDGRVFVAEKRGTIQMFDGPGDATATQVADLRTEVFNLGDRGLLGLAVDPEFPNRPYLYALYAFDGPIGGTAPTWGTGADSDVCPNEPVTTTSGCIASGKLVRLTLNGTTTTKEDLVHGWCLHWNSHALDDLVFGPDGALYASSGDSASSQFVDYGQTGNPRNPCSDPPSGVGGPMTPPAAEGGALRSQDLRTAGDPVGLNGTVIRVSPDSGDALQDNPAAAAADENTRRIVAYGLRNPFRMTVRPGTDELWIGDVGWRAHEEIDRIADPTAAVVNFGWPCYEGAGRQDGYDAADLALCENLYGQPAETTAPWFSYAHRAPVNASDTCLATSGSSVAGLAFLSTPESPYPDAYDGALFVADYARQCIWVMSPAAGGLPDPATLRPFLTAGAVPVDLQVSPGGELFYVDIAAGEVRRIVYTGDGACPTGTFRAEYFPNRTLAGAPASVLCEGAPLVHRWGAGGPAGLGPDEFSVRWTGTFDFPSADTYTFTARSDDGIRVWVDGTPLIDQWTVQTATTVRASRSLPAGPHEVRVEYFEGTGQAVAELGWVAATEGAAPQPVIATPSAGTTWGVGDMITFSGSASDAEDGTLPASALSWELDLMHCPSECHAHPLPRWSGVASGSFTTPDHEYPAHLELRLTATDSSGRSTTVSRRLDPRTVGITVATQPTGLSLTMDSTTATAPFTGTVIVGSATSLSAPAQQTRSGSTYTFSRWSDGGSPSHNVTAGTTAATYTATYTLTGCPRGQYRAQYFPNTTLSGTAAVNRCEAAPLNRNWGSGAAPGVPANNFSARWTGSFSMTAGRKTFTAASNDGIRVWLDGVLIVDRWTSSGTTTVTRTVAAGVHTVRVDYVERTGSAFARLTW